MVSQAQVLEHLEPVVFTFAVCLLGIIIDDYCPKRLADLVKKYNPIPRLSEKIEAASYSLREKWLEPFRSAQQVGQQQQRAMAAQEMAPIKPLTSFTLPTAQQDASPLLNLPGEILDLIVQYTLTPQPDLSNPYDLTTCYRRPGNLAPLQTSTNLLQTCQALYSPYWFLPWTLSTHTFYLTSSGRCPDQTTSIDEMMQISYLIENLHPTAPTHLKQVAAIQVFPQLYMLESGATLLRILSIPHFHPRSVTITIRHTDWWWWEADEPLHFSSSNFVGLARFPPSTTTVTMELETLTRKRDQVLWMADHIAKNWHFTRVDNTHLVADPDPATHETNAWSGSATWEGERWIRDEDDAEPNVLRYAVVSVPFRAVRLADDPEGYAERYERVFGNSVHVDSEVAGRTRARDGGVGNLSVYLMEEAGVDSERVCASEALRRVRVWEREAEYEAYEVGELFDGQGHDTDER